MQSTRSAKHALISSTLRHIASKTGSFPKSLPDLKQNNFIGSFYQFGCDIRNKSYKQNVQIKEAIEVYFLSIVYTCTYVYHFQSNLFLISNNFRNVHVSNNSTLESNREQKSNLILYLLYMTV